MREVREWHPPLMVLVDPGDPTRPQMYGYVRLKVVSLETPIFCCKVRISALRLERAFSVAIQRLESDSVSSPF